MLSRCPATATGSTLAVVSAVRVAGAGAGCAGAGSAAGASAGFPVDAAAGSSAGASSPAASIIATTPPSDRLSPTLTLSSFTTPANGDGTSIVALSDSSVTRPWSFATVSPTATSTSITGTSS